MAKGFKTGGRNFKPGQVTNPLGANAHNKELKTIRMMTKLEVAEMGTLILDSNIAQMKAIKEDPESKVLKLLMASVVIKGIAKGDAGALNVILDRIVGKVKEEVVMKSEITEIPVNKEQVRQALKEIEDEF